MNNVTVTGRWTREPELTYTPNGTAVFNCTIAVKDQTSDNNTVFLKVKAFQKYAETVANLAYKGQRVLVDGRLVQRKYEKDGQKKVIVEIVANNIEFFTFKDDPDEPEEARPVFDTSRNPFTDKTIKTIQLDDSELPF